MEEEYRGYNFRKEHGLPDDDVRDILQTRDGSLWILTQSGLVRYDGINFTIFSRGNTPDFQSDDPRVLAEDRDSRLWVGGRNLLLRMSGGRLGRVTLPGADRFATVSAICADSEGMVWIGGEHSVAGLGENGVAVYGPDSGLDSDGHVTSIVQTPSGSLFVGTFGGLFRFDPARRHFDRAGPPPHQPGHADAVLSLHVAANGRLWGMFDQVIDARTHSSQHRWIGVLSEGVWGSPMAAGPAQIAVGYGLPFMLENQRGELWLPAEPNELHRLRQGQLERVQLALPQTRDVATCMRQDREGSLWMGTLNSGLWRWQRRQLRTYSTPDALPQENVWAVCEGPDGALWIGTDGGLARHDAGRWDQWTTTQGLSRNTIRALAVDRKNTVWIGTGEGLNSWRDGKMTRHPIPGDWFESKIRVILPTRDGILWVAGATGLHRLAGDQQTRFTTAEGLSKNDVRALLEDSAGRLWIGTFGGGLQCYDNGRFTTLSTTNGLASEFVWALHEDAEGVIWIGTEAGLHCLSDGRLTRFGRAQGLPDALVNFILEDDAGQFWISHDHGIYRVRRSALVDLAEGRTNTVHCVSYTQADGLPSEETNGQKSYPPACKARDGRLWFATTKGVVVIDPAQHHEEDVPPQVVIERFRATGEMVFTTDPLDPPSLRPMPAMNPSRETSGRIDSTSEEHAIALPPGSGRVIEFDYTANTFVSADRVRFRSRLLGLDEQWGDATTRRSAVFTNLRPGHYRFQVIAANHHGVWNEVGATCAFRIAPAFHETWWFYATGGAAMLAIGTGAAVWRIREMRKIHRLEQQAAVAAERSRIAQDLHDGLGADLTRLSALAEWVSTPSASPSPEHLSRLARSSRETIRGLKDLIWMANPNNDTLESFLDRLCLTAEDFLRDAQIGCRFDLTPARPELPFSLEKRRNLLLVIREALNNVAKHSGASAVLITARVHGEHLDLMLQDNGHGFDAGAVRPGTMGLTGMRGRIEKLGGRLEIESSAATGTRIRLRIPLPSLKNGSAQE